MNTKMAIVGMDTIFGIDEGLDEFDRTIFDGLQQAARLSPDRPKKIRAGTKSEYKEDCARILNEPAPPSALTLMRLVIDRTLQGTLSGSTERDWNDLALIVVSEAEVPGLEKGMSRFITETSVFNALQTARDLLFSEEVRGVMLGAVHCPPHGVDPGQVDKCTNCNGLSVGEGAGAVFLKRVDQADMDQDHIYAIIEAVVVEPHGLPQEKVRLSQQVDAMTKRAFSIAGVGPGEISYLEASGLGIEGTEQPEIEGLAQAYGSDKNGLTCALGNVKANIGEASVVTVLASIVKAALCAHHRYIPATPGWTGPENEGLWQESPFYVAMESRPWFVNQAFPQRVAQVSSLVRGEVAEVILSEDIRQKSRPNLYLELVSPYCFPLLGDDRAELSDQLESLKRTVETSVSLKDAAAKSLATFQNGSEGAYALMIVGHGQEELLREIQFMMKGIPDAFEKGREVKTPKGSYFTANPLGEEGKVAFVYPGVGSAYVGLGHSMFQLFPELYDRCCEVTPNVGDLLREKELYPRTRQPLTEDDIWKRELRLRKDISTIGECGMGFFGLFTGLLRDVFEVTPDYAIGYSMGEPGMFASLGVWVDPGQLTERFSDSPTFRENLHGEMHAAREYWSLNEEGAGADKKIWDSFVLQATPARVREAIEGEERVFLTIINAPEEVAIAGDPESCRRVIKEMGCKHYPLGLDLILHCEPSRLEYDRIMNLYTLPVAKNPGIKFYSSSCYKPIPIRSKAIAHSIAKAHCETVDFPRLVNQAYEDGARLFIEIGSRKFCSNLIDKILKGKDHLAMAINVKGTKDQASLVRLLAQLVSHRVPVDLSRLF